MTAAAFRKPVLIYNPVAGRLRKNNQALLHKTVAALAEADVRPELLPTTGPDTAGGIAKSAIGSGADLVIGLGGDGTINEIARGVIGTQVPLAILPGGTANVLSLETRIGSNAVKSARRIGERVPHRVAVGVLRRNGADPRYFLAMAGIGLDAAVVRAVNPEIKKATGKFAYWVAGFQRFFGSLQPVAWNGYQRYGFVLASRVRNYGGDLELARQASLLRDEFEIVTFKGTNPLPYVAYMSAAVIRQHALLPGVDVHRSARLEFPEPGADIQVDGELVGTTPATLEIAPDALTLLLPREYRG